MSGKVTVIQEHVANHEQTSNGKAVTNMRGMLLVRGLAILSALSFFAALFSQLWGMVLTSTFYFQGLHLNVYANRVTGDLRELNILNHYIGMLTIGSSMPEFHYIGYIITGLLILSIAVALFPAHRLMRIIVLVQTLLLAVLAADFLYRLYEYGHNFDPAAPIKVDPFMPQIWGNYHLANFQVSTAPGNGSLFMILGYLLMFGVLSLEKHLRPQLMLVRKM
jgi:copper chaperone NosL